MQSKVVRHGESLYLLIPADMRRELGLKENQKVELSRTSSGFNVRIGGN